MKTLLRNKINGVTVEVHQTTENPASSYGKPVWEDNEGQAYCQVGMESPFYEIWTISTLEHLADFLNEIVLEDFPTEIVEKICEANGWTSLCGENEFDIATDGKNKVTILDNKIIIESC